MSFRRERLLPWAKEGSDGEHDEKKRQRMIMVKAGELSIEFCTVSRPFEQDKKHTWLDKPG